MISWPDHNMLPAMLYSTHCPIHAVNRRPSPNYLNYRSHSVDNRSFLTLYPNQEELHDP